MGMTASGSVIPDKFKNRGLLGVSQLDGTLGYTGAVTEMLVQSHDGTIHLLPALPKAWADGKIKGFKARGNFDIDMKWRQATFRPHSLPLRRKSKSSHLRLRNHQA
jgi:alpha-L-fucosidase 2